MATRSGRNPCTMWSAKCTLRCALCAVTARMSRQQIYSLSGHVLAAAARIQTRTFHVGAVCGAADALPGVEAHTAAYAQLLRGLSPCLVPPIGIEAQAAGIVVAGSRGVVDGVKAGAHPP